MMAAVVRLRIITKKELKGAADLLYLGVRTRSHVIPLIIRLSVVVADAFIGVLAIINSGNNNNDCNRVTTFCFRGRL